MADRPSATDIQAVATTTHRRQRLENFHTPGYAPGSWSSSSAIRLSLSRIRARGFPARVAQFLVPTLRDGGIAYIPVRRGFLYLVAIRDWASRHVLAWGLSNTLDAGFRTEALEEALAR